MRFLIFLLIIPIAGVIGQSSLDSIHEIGLNYFQKGQNLLWENFDSSIIYHKKAIPYLEKAKDWENYVECFNSIAVVHYNKGTFSECEKYILQAEKESLKYLQDTSSIHLSIIGNLGVYYTTKGHIHKGIAQNKLQLSKDRNPVSRANAFANLAFDYKKIGEFELAVMHYKKSISLYQDSSKTLKWQLGLSYKNLGTLYMVMKEFKLAQESFHNGLNVYRKFPPKNEVVIVNKITALNYLAETLLKLNYPDSSLNYLEQVLKLHRAPKSQYHFLTYSNLGKTYQHLNRISEARQAFQRSIKEVLKQHSEFNKYEVIARYYTNYAEFEAEIGNYKDALKQYQIALIRVALDFENSDAYSNPKAENIIHNPEGLRALTGKAKTLYKLFQQSNNSKDLKAALATYEVAHQLIQRARQDILSRGSKHQLAGEVLPVYEGAIQAAIELNRITKETSYLEKAFLFAESNKALLLLESLNENIAKNYGGIPDTLLVKEKEMRLDIVFYEKLINQEKAKTEGDEEKIENWESQRFNLRQKYNDLVKVLEKEYPRYHEIKYQSRIASVQDIQKQVIGTKDAFLEYFVGDQYIYLFQITKEDLKVFDLTVDATFLEDIQNYLSTINYPYRDEVGVQKFVNASSLIYEKYLAPGLLGLSKDIKRLIIIPDDALGYIPFEALINQATESSNKPNNFSPNQLNYLFESYFINYAYSGTLLQQGLQFQPKQKMKTFLGLAPSFGNPIAEANRNCSSDELYSLNCSSQEVNSIGALLKGSTLTGIQAEKAQFLEQAKDYRILHLATHSCADAENHMLNKIFFTDDFISNYDLFNMRLNAELAVLSSCNTGSGELIKGEGVMSLSKGFFHAGCPSTLMSLWSVDDCATSDIMIQYYQFLKQGQDKDAALRSAKLAYLNSTDKAHQHPYYWAAFVQMGNFTPIDLGSEWNWWRGVVLCLGIVGMFGIWFFKRRAV